MKSLVRKLTPDLNSSLRSRRVGRNSTFCFERSARPLTGRRIARWPVLNLIGSLLGARFVPGVTNAFSLNQAFACDQLDRLTSFNAGVTGATTLAIGAALVPNETVTYDDIGNRRNSTTQAPSVISAQSTSCASTIGRFKHHVGACMHSEFRIRVDRGDVVLL